MKKFTMDAKEMEFQANALIGTELAKAACEGARRVALNGANSERAMFVKAIAEGADLPDAILNYINAAEKSLAAAKEADVLPTEWLDDVAMFVANIMANELAGEPLDDTLRPIYVLPLEEPLKAWAAMGVAARPAMLEAISFAMAEAEGHVANFNGAMLN